jgi:flagellar hook-length control protein FliK
MIVSTPIPMQPPALLVDSQGGESNAKNASAQFANLLALATGEEDDKDSQAGTVLAAPELATAERAVLDLGGSETRLEPAAAKRLARTIWQAAVKNKADVTLLVKPGDMGQLKLRISMRGDQIFVHGMADEGKVAEMLNASKQELEDALSRWGLRLGGFTAEQRATDVEGISSTQSAAVHRTEAEELDLESRFPSRSYVEVIV